MEKIATPVDSSESSSDDSDDDSEDLVDSLVFTGDPPVKVIGAENFVQDVLKNYYSNLKSISPESYPDFNNVKVVRFKSDLLLNLDLSFKRNFNIFQNRQIVVFDQSLGYNSIDKENLNKILLKEKGCLLEESNFEIINPILLDYLTEGLSLRNQRVVFIWRDIYVSYDTAKRVLSLGLGCLIGAISKAELIFEIRQVIQNDTFDIAIEIQHNVDTQIRIGVYGSVFRR